jgi:hypothetical protein
MTTTWVWQRSIGTWLLRLLAALFAGWGVYRGILVPDWCVRVPRGAGVDEVSWRDWVWSPPVGRYPGGEVLGIRWGWGIFLLVANAWMARIAWTLASDITRPRGPIRAVTLLDTRHRIGGVGGGRPDQGRCDEPGR